MWKYEKPEMEVIEFEENICTDNLGASGNIESSDCCGQAFL